MLKYLNKSQVNQYLTCPYCFTKSHLIQKQSFFECSLCKRHYPYSNHIVKFVNAEKLDKETARELKGNTFKLNKKNIKHFAQKDRWSNFYNHFVMQKFKYLYEFLDKIDYKSISSLGSGPGFEVKKILKHKLTSLVLSSDLALSATSVVPYTLKYFNTTLCLFTSDLNYSPVIPYDNHPIIIYEALHHSGMLKTIEKLYKRKYKYILFVEPCTNFFVRIMEKLGIAGRIEYSGLKPEFCDLKRLKNLSHKYGYKIQIKTIWEIPEDYFRKIVKNEGLIQNIILILTDCLSKLGNLFMFGNFAIVILERSNSKISKTFKD